VVRVKSFHTRCLFPAGPESARTKSPPRLALAAWGEVYRANDLKLGRAVALKVLSPGLAGDADYMARFTRDAQVLASLNQSKQRRYLWARRSQRRTHYIFRQRHINS
jgi:serine/threonine protein kinase